MKKRFLSLALAAAMSLTLVTPALAAETAGKVIQMENDIFASWPRADVEQYLELTERFLLDLRERGKKIEKGGLGRGRPLNDLRQLVAAGP